MIVDSSALIAILRGEADGPALRERALHADSVRLSAVTLVETRIVAARDRGPDELDQLLSTLSAEIVPVETRQADAAWEAFQRFGKGRHPAALNLGDLFSYALARTLDEPLLFKGKDFSQTDIEPALRRP